MRIERVLASVRHYPFCRHKTSWRALASGRSTEQAAGLFKISLDFFLLGQSSQALDNGGQDVSVCYTWTPRKGGTWPENTWWSLWTTSTRLTGSWPGSWPRESECWGWGLDFVIHSMVTVIIDCCQSCNTLCRYNCIELCYTLHSCSFWYLINYVINL